jgi:ubiquinol oxidase
MLNINKADIGRHHEPDGFGDRFALATARLIAAGAGWLFGRRYGGRAVVIETIAAVPAMVAATLLHLTCLRRMIDDGGWVRVFMEEAENQRAHLMAFVAIQRPNTGERLLIVLGQGLFYNAYFLLYLISPRTAHRLAGYLAEESARGYTRYLARIEEGTLENGAAPALAGAYWNLPPDAPLAAMIQAMREDETLHRDIHHAFADALAQGHVLPPRPGLLP